MSVDPRGTSQQIRVHQFHYSTTSGDAITNQMIFLREALREVGVQGEIYSVKNAAPPSYGIRPFSPVEMWSSDLILVHHSQGNPALSALLQIEIPKALVYHNITPPRFFRHDPRIADLCSIGRRQLRGFLGNIVASFTVSRYNARELESLGFPASRSLPLFDLSATAVPSTTRATRAANAERVLLFVGRVAPHKNQALLIKTLYYLQKAAPNEYRLVLVGGGDRVYSRYLKLLAQSLGLSSRVEIAGAVSQEELEKRYARADAFVCVSRHEGFCVPVVEAMRRNVPVFAVPSTGVRETLGDAGVRLISRLPHRIAAALDTVLDDRAAVKTLLQLQRARLETIALQQNKAAAQGPILEVVHALRHPLRPRILTSEEPHP